MGILQISANFVFTSGISQRDFVIKSPLVYERDLNSKLLCSSLQHTASWYNIGR